MGAKVRSEPMQLSFTRETELRDSVAAWIGSIWPAAHVADEVGPRWAPADLVAKASEGDRATGVLLVSVELKLRDGRRALAQATLHQLFADLSYIAMPVGRITGTLRADAVKHGVGVLGVHPDGSVECLADATPSVPSDALAMAADEVVTESARGTRPAVPIGGSRGGTPPLVTAP